MLTKKTYPWYSTDKINSSLCDTLRNLNKNYDDMMRMSVYQSLRRDRRRRYDPTAPVMIVSPPEVVSDMTVISSESVNQLILS